MKLKLCIKKNKLFCYALSMYLIWVNFIIGVKWNAQYLVMMNSLGRAVMIVILLLLGLCLIFQKRLAKSYLLSEIIIIVTGVVIYFKTKDNNILFLVLFMFAAKGLDFDEIVECFAINQVISLVGILVVFYAGLSQNVTSYFSYGVGFSLGTYHANNLATIVMSGFFALSYCILKNKLWLESLVAIIIAIFLWNITLSRTNCLLIILLPISHILIHYMKKTRSTFLLRISKSIVILLLLISAGMSIFYNSVNSIFTDGTFAERFRFGLLAFKRYGVHLFGSNIQYISTVEAKISGIENMVLDSAYIKILFAYGIIATICFVFAYTSLISKSIKMKNYDFLIISILFAISGITQSTVITVYDFILLAMFTKNFWKREEFRNEPFTYKIN